MSQALAPSPDAPVVLARASVPSRHAESYDPVGDFLVQVLSPFFVVGYHLAVTVLRATRPRD